MNRNSLALLGIRIQNDLKRYFKHIKTNIVVRGEKN